MSKGEPVSFTHEFGYSNCELLVSSAVARKMSQMRHVSDCTWPRTHDTANHLGHAWLILANPYLTQKLGILRCQEKFTLEYNSFPEQADYYAGELVANTISRTLQCVGNLPANTLLTPLSPIYNWRTFHFSWPLLHVTLPGAVKLHGCFANLPLLKQPTWPCACFRPDSHRTHHVTRTQIKTFFLWCCLRAVWTLPLMTTGPICLRRVASRVLCELGLSKTDKLDNAKCLHGTGPESWVGLWYRGGELEGCSVCGAASVP